jgi:predicted phage terminase large subunit-like protein
MNLTKRKCKALLAQKYLIDFTEYTFPQYRTQWFHSLICDKLDALLIGKIKRLMVFVPPQHGKSSLVSHRFPAHVLGRFPDTKIAVCSYSGDLASKINRQVQRIIDDSKYRDLFPHVKLGGTRANEGVRTQDEFEIVGHLGSLKTVGVGGPLTGNPVDIGIIDDPVKDAMEAQSATDRNRKWEWYNEVFTTRLHNDSKVLLTMTRWHEDDLAGRILRYEPGRWEVLKLPYIKEDSGAPQDKRQLGEALWPDRHNAEKAMQIKANSERTYASLLQQRPAPQDGGIFKRSWFKDYTRLPLRFEKVIMSWDCSFKDTKTSDYVVGMVIGKVGADSYIIDMVRGRWDFPETVRRIRALCAAHPLAGEKLIEEKANGAAIIQTIKHEIPGVIAINPTESKEARASSVSYVVEGGNVYLPQSSTWRDTLLYELSAFPNGSNDDIVDAFTQALNRLYGRQGAYTMRVAI